jgi:hypothetical protein
VPMQEDWIKGKQTSRMASIKRNLSGCDDVCQKGGNRAATTTPLLNNSNKLLCTEYTLILETLNVSVSSAWWVWCLLLMLLASKCILMLLEADLLTHFPKGVVRLLRPSIHHYCGLFVVALLLLMVLHASPYPL